MQARGWALAALAWLCAGCAGAPSADRGDWPAYGRTALGDRHSPLTQITPDNVAALEVAWRYSAADGEDAAGFLETTPIVADGAMYIAAPLGKAIALDPTTGAEIWSRDLGVVDDGRRRGGISRGASLWRAADASMDDICSARIFVGVVDRLHALDARTGDSCTDFGADGTVDLRRGLRNPPRVGEAYGLTSPPAIVGDLVIVGSLVSDNASTEAASGEVRAYDVRTGALVWTWDPIPQDAADPAHASWEGPRAHATGGANTWSVITADPGRDLVFLPTGSASVDFWGGHRLGDNRYANSVVALRASTGELVWHFQTVHHDLWDYDNAAPPALVTIERGGRRIDVVVQGTKTGQLFVLDRETGAPVFPVEERPVPASDVPGERTAPTQPFSSLALGTPQDAGAVWGPTPEAEADCRALLATARHQGAFTPPSVQGSLVTPSSLGGVHWGGVAYDPDRGLALVPTNRIAALVTLSPRADAGPEEATADGPFPAEHRPMEGSPFRLRRIRTLFCLGPPFGELSAVDLREGRIAWSIPLGSGDGMPGPGAEGIVGVPNLGGAITTASGLAFIGAAADGWFRAFDTASGAELWRARLPAPGMATPMTYLGRDGRQYVAIAAGGGVADMFGLGSGDEIVAFALPGPAP